MWIFLISTKDFIIYQWFKKLASIVITYKYVKGDSLVKKSWHLWYFPSHVQQFFLSIQYFHLITYICRYTSYIQGQSCSFDHFELQIYKHCYPTQLANRFEIALSIYFILNNISKLPSRAAAAHVMLCYSIRSHFELALPILIFVSQK